MRDNSTWRRLASGLLIAAGLATAGVEAQTSAPDKCSPGAVRAEMANERVPDLVGCTIAQASRAWSPYVGKIPLNQTRAESNRPVGEVTRQEPKAGSPTAYLEAGLNLVVSSGPPAQTTPPIRAQRIVVLPAATAQEGSVLRFQVTREPDGIPITVHYRALADEGAVAGVDFAPAEGDLIFGPKDRSQTVEVKVNERAGENGERIVRLHAELIDDGEAIMRADGLGTIVDAAEPIPGFVASASFVPDGRTAVLEVRRSGALQPYTLRYDATLSAPGYEQTSAAQLLLFEQGQESARATVNLDGCGQAVRFAVYDPAGAAPIENAQVAVDALPPPGPECSGATPPPPEEEPWWQDPIKIVAVAIAVLALVAAWLLLLRKRPDPLPDPVDEPSAKLVESPPPPPPPALVPIVACSFEGHEGGCCDDAGPPFELPPVRVTVTTTWDEGTGPADLPITEITERDDG